MADQLDKTVLVVDDEPDVVRFLQMALEDDGFTVVTASDGLEGLEKARKFKPDLISMDLVMPKHSGAKMYRELQKDKELKKIPVLIVTGHAHDELGKADLEELTMSGPGIYLEKPVKPSNYVANVRKMLDMPDSGQPEKKSGDTDKLKEELESLAKDADPEKLKKIIDELKKK
ncbi:MAG: response regulator [candidate division Zixibacteria bacterium]|nr:response regulator [candidate division Zixibacteria bacterium]NIR62545.1 response regulator [candidate division Zixibacteria bacterium]NIS18258.1 response regulator [candidate division Zixibacteria bacterium]NIS44678.1 response regulator [candidate division Zixibacteria bacterium]NIT54544.1 response regulator [candidate division Zixibacteria bacterium]